MARAKKVKKLKINPSLGHLYVRRIKEEEVTKGGLLIPDGAKEKPQQGIVVFTRTENEYNEVGANILFGKYAGVEIKLNDEILLILKEEEVLGRVVES